LGPINGPDNVQEPTQEGGAATVGPREERTPNSAPGPPPTGATKPISSVDRGSVLGTGQDIGSLVAADLGEAQETGSPADMSSGQRVLRIAAQDQEISPTEAPKREKRVRKIPGHFQDYV